MKSRLLIRLLNTLPAVEVAKMLTSSGRAAVIEDGRIVRLEGR